MKLQSVWESLCYQHDKYIFQLQGKEETSRIQVKNTAKKDIGYITPNPENKKTSALSGIKNHWLMVANTQNNFNTLTKIVDALQIPGNVIKFEISRQQKKKTPVKKTEIPQPAKKKTPENIKTTLAEMDLYEKNRKALRKLKKRLKLKQEEFKGELMDLKDEIDKKIIERNFTSWTEENY